MRRLSLCAYGLAVADDVDDGSDLDIDDAAAMAAYDAQLEQLQQSRQDVFFNWLQLQPLTSLSISACDELRSSSDSSSDSKDEPSVKFSAIGCAAMTASSRLQELECSWLEFDFPAAAQCLMLTKLVFLGHPQLGPGPALNWASKVQQLVQCCPALRELSLEGDRFGWLELSLLLPLTGLTDLAFDGFDDEQVLQLLLLTQLRALSLPAAAASDAAVEELAGLQRLTRLFVHSKGFSRWMPCKPYNVVNLKQGTKVSPPNILKAGGGASLSMWSNSCKARR